MYTMIYTLDNFFINQRESAACTEPIIQIEIILTWKTPIIGRNIERKIIKFLLSIYGTFFFSFPFLTQTLWEQAAGMGSRKRLSGEIKWQKEVPSLVWGSTCLERRDFRDSSSLLILQMRTAIVLMQINHFFLLQSTVPWIVFWEKMVWISLISVMPWWTLKVW